MNRWLDEVQSITGRIERLSKDIRTMLAINELLGDVDLSDVASHWVYQDAQGLIRVELALKDDKRDSKLAHALARKLSVRFTKGKAWDNSSLYLTADLPATDQRPAFRIKIEGAVPKTCEVRVVETPLTAEEFEAAKVEALNNIKATKVTREIVCSKR